MAQQIKVVKEYQVVGYKIPVGTILTEVPYELGFTAFQDISGTKYIFENSEILFSHKFHESFVLI